MIKLVPDDVGILLQENLVESKHHKLARSLRSGPSDHDLKPNAATRDQLNVSDKEKKKYTRNLLRCLYNTVFLSQIIVSYPPTKQLSSEEQDLVWKFRYYLTTQEKVRVSIFKTIRKFGVRETFIQQRHIKLNKSYSKTCRMLEKIIFHACQKYIMISTKILSTTVCNIDNDKIIFEHQITVLERQEDHMTTEDWSNKIENFNNISQYYRLTIFFI